ncbi:MAG TPA: glutamyl-tRNA reductase, partial [Thermodesulfobacteriota bacterium]|nr:glutamyl-tRNA reductase [Thermodesulfobacteriota bacterium]
MQRIIVVGLSHKTAPVEIRERFSFNQEELEDGLSALASKPHIEECMIVSTCNRVEVYAVSENTDGCVESINEFLSEFHSISADAFSPYLYTSIGHMAVRHFYKVASGIDSMVVGEPQITGQVKEAFQRAQDAAVVGHELTRLMNRAFAVAKRVRNETGVGSSAVSISFVAVELARKVFEDLKGSAVMLLGAGEMAELAAKHLLNYGASRLLIVNRTFENAVALAGELNGEPVPFEEFEKRLPEAEILICSTGAPDYLIRPDHVRRALERRRNRPVLLVDISVPRNIDPAIGRLDNAFLFDVDDLEAVAEANRAERKR